MRRKRRRKNPMGLFDPISLVAMAVTAGAGILGMSAAKEQAKAATDEQRRIEMQRRGEIEKQQMLDAANTQQKALFDASNARRNQTIAILAGVGGFAALMGFLFISASNKKG